MLSPGSWSVPGTVEKEKKRKFSAYRKATKIKCRTGFNNYKSVNEQIKRSKNNNYWKDRFCVCVTGPTCNSATQRKRERKHSTINSSDGCSAREHDDFISWD